MRADLFGVSWWPDGQYLSIDLPETETYPFWERLTSHGSKVLAPSWEPFPVWIPEPALRRVDVMLMGGEFVLREKAREALGPLLERHGELLPLLHEEPLYLFHCTTIAGDVFAEESNLGDLVRPPRAVPKPGFEPPSLFWVEHPAASLYGYHNDSRPDEDDIRLLVDRSEVTGLRFPVAWDSDHGAYDLDWTDL